MLEIKINIEDEMDEEIKEIEEKTGMSREEIAKEALKMYLLKIKKAPIMKPEILKAVEIQEALAKEDSIVWDSSEVLRRWRETK